MYECAREPFEICLKTTVRNITSTSVENFDVKFVCRPRFRTIFPGSSISCFCFLRVRVPYLPFTRCIRGVAPSDIEIFAVHTFHRSFGNRRFFHWSKRRRSQNRFARIGSVVFRRLATSTGVNALFFDLGNSEESPTEQRGRRVGLDARPGAAFSRPPCSFSVDGRDLWATGKKRRRPQCSTGRRIVCAARRTRGRDPAASPYADEFQRPAADLPTMSCHIPVNYSYDINETNRPSAFQAFRNPYDCSNGLSRERFVYSKRSKCGRHDFGYYALRVSVFFPFVAHLLCIAFFNELLYNTAVTRRELIYVVEISVDDNY